MKATRRHLQTLKTYSWILLFTAIPLCRAAMADGAPAGHLLKTRRVRHVLVSIPQRQLAVVEDGKVIRTFPVAVGAKLSPSPMGRFRIVSRVTDPTYYHSGAVIPPGDENPVGPRWIGLNLKGYGIHGTNDPRSIGMAASHGCIRLRNRDVAEFFELVSVGDVVEIRGEPNQDAQLSPDIVASDAQASLAGAGQ